MHRTNLSVDEMLADDDHATAYARREGVVVPVPQRPLPAIAPAGAINSSAADMARWLLAQLGGGQLDGATVMSPATAKRQRSPHMVIPGFGEVPGLSAYAYGLGWLNGRYREHEIAMHASSRSRSASSCRRPRANGGRNATYGLLLAGYLPVTAVRGARAGPLGFPVVPWRW